MTLGEQARLIISYDYAYGERGFPGAVILLIIMLDSSKSRFDL